MSALGVGVMAIGALVLYPPFIALLRRLGAGQQIRPEGPAAHLAKAGTPTAGGLLFVALALVAWALPGSSREALAPLAALAAGALLGLADDLRNVRGARALGLPAAAKFTVQWGLAALALIPLGYLARPDLQFVPWLGTVELGWAWVPLGLVAMVAAANAVNLTDGSDALAANVTLSALAVLLVLGARAGWSVAFLLLPLGLSLALVSFSFHNAPPARVFMGDTGAMALGFFLASLSLQMHMVLLLPLIGIVYVAETVSVMAQVAYFKRTGGRRLLRMAPLHHDLQLRGWSEARISLALPALNLIGGALAVALTTTGSVAQ